MNFGFIPSLFLYFGCLSIIYAVGLHYFLRDKDLEVVEHWSRGVLVWGAAVLTTVFRAELPLWLSYFLANGVAFVAYIEINRGLLLLTAPEPAHRRHYDRKDTLVLLVGGSLGYALLLYAVHLWTPEAYRELAKTSFVSLLVVLVCFQGAEHCFSIARQHKLRIATVFAWLFIIVGGLWGARVVSAAAGHGTYVFDASLINSLIFIAIFITGMLKYLMLPMLLLQKTEKDSRSQLRNTLLKANKTVTSGGLSASLAHELNQPLAAIRLNGQILRKTLQDQGGSVSAEVEAMVNDILSENDRASKIIASLRSIFMNTPANWTQVDSASLVRKALTLVNQEVEKSNIHVKCVLAENLQITVAEDEILQVLLNLLVNSMDALKAQSHSQVKCIAIETVRQNDCVRISVADNGPGISQEMQAVLFEILSSSKETGMGLGLWLSRYIVERHSGQLTYTTSTLGGAMFMVDLPIAHNSVVIGL
jgi:signal transduction histidine kinase